MISLTDWNLHTGFKDMISGLLWNFHFSSFFSLLIGRFGRFFFHCRIWRSENYYEKKGKTFINPKIPHISKGNNGFFLNDGRLKCNSFQSPSQGKSEVEENGAVEIARCFRGQYFGELALVTNKPRAASAHAIGTVKCLGRVSVDLLCLHSRHSNHMGHYWVHKCQSPHKI